MDKKMQHTVYECVILRQVPLRSTGIYINTKRIYGYFENNITDWFTNITEKRPLPVSQRMRERGRQTQIDGQTERGGEYNA